MGTNTNTTHNVTNPLPDEVIDLQQLKAPPHSLQAEQSVLGGLMIASDSWDSVSDIICANDFYRGVHRRIFAQMLSLIEADEPIDVITLAEALNKQGELETIGGVAYLVQLAQQIPSITNVNAYTKIVRERSDLRTIIAVANRIADSAYQLRDGSSAELINEAERQIIQITENRPNRGGAEAIKPLLTRTLDRIDMLYKVDNGLTGLSTGFTDLDKYTLGLQPTDLIIVAARPSMGKTAFVMNLVEHAVLHGDKPVIVFSMEMSAESLMMRILSSVGRINQSKIRSGKLAQDDWPKLDTATNQLMQRPLFIDDASALTPTAIRSSVRQMARRHGALGMIVVDYLQLMQVAGTTENRTTEISAISRGLKAIAKEFNCPLVAVSQLNRSLEQRPNKRPINSDLRESGAIEQDADVIICLYRDEVYNEESVDKGIAEIIIRKQRNGPIGTVRLAFNGEYTRFDNLTTHYDDETAEG